MSGQKLNCIVHPEREATERMTVPCAPGGFLPVCDECKKPEAGQAVFEAYKASHSKHIKVFKQENPGS